MAAPKSAVAVIPTISNPRWRGRMSRLLMMSRIKSVAPITNVPLRE